MPRASHDARRRWTQAGHARAAHIPSVQNARDITVPAASDGELTYSTAGGQHAPAGKGAFPRAPVCRLPATPEIHRMASSGAGASSSHENARIALRQARRMLSCGACGALLAPSVNISCANHEQRRAKASPIRAGARFDIPYRVPRFPRRGRRAVNALTMSVTRIDLRRANR